MYDVQQSFFYLPGTTNVQQRHVLTVHPHCPHFRSVTAEIKTYETQACTIGHPPTLFLAVKWSWTFRVSGPVVRTLYKIPPTCLRAFRCTRARWPVLITTQTLSGNA